MNNLEKIIEMSKDFPWKERIRRMTIKVKNTTFNSPNEQREKITLLLALLKQWHGETNVNTVIEIEFNKEDDE